MQVRKQQLEPHIDWLEPQEATVSTTHRLITSWERSTLRLYIVTLLINLHAEYILRNTRMDEAQVGIKIARRNINNLRYADGDCSMPGFPVHHQLPELTQTRVYQVGDAIQPSHPLSSPSPTTFNLYQHQGLFQ